VAVALAPLEPPEHCFLDEDAIFDMPGLIDDMDRGMLLTPPTTTGSWGAVDDDVDCTGGVSQGGGRGRGGSEGADCRQRAGRGGVVAQEREKRVIRWGWEKAEGGGG
jgi:hypothetical protein